MARLDVMPGLPGPFKDLIVGPIRQNSFTHEFNRVWTGNNGASTNNMYRVGRITAPVKGQDGAINRFFFHYNPQSVTVQSSSDPTVRAADNTATGDRTFSNITANETMSFDFLLNRIPDVALQQPNSNDSAKVYGTLHDLYYLYGLINQNFGSPIIGGLEYPNTDEGLLQPTAITVIFGELFRFYGNVIQISVQHAKFIASPIGDRTSAPLIPVLTTVSLSLARVNPGDANAAPNPEGGTGTSVGGQIAGKIGGGLPNPTNPAPIPIPVIGGGLPNPHNPAPPPKSTDAFGQPN